MAERKTWTARGVAEHFEEAFRTLRQLPPVTVQGYFNTWPEVVRTSQEIAAMEPQPLKVRPSAGAIDRLEQTFDWMLWLDERERRLVWSRAARVEKRAKVGDALRGGISWRCPDAVNSLPRKGYATCKRIPLPSCPIHPVSPRMR